MGYSPFANSHFQMGVTVMGFAEHIGLSFTALKINNEAKINSELMAIFESLNPTMI